MSKKTLPFSYYVDELIVKKEFTYDEWDQVSHRFFLKKKMMQDTLIMVAILIWMGIIPFMGMIYIEMGR